MCTFLPSDSFVNCSRVKEMYLFEDWKQVVPDEQIGVISFCPFLINTNISFIIALFKLLSEFYIRKQVLGEMVEVFNL